MFNQQCWLWGYDIRRSDGNLLLAHGFERSVPPPGEQGSRTYTLATPERHLALWAFGLWYGVPEVGGVFFNRFDGIPRRTVPSSPLAQIWRPDQLPLDHSPVCHMQRRTLRALTADAFAWIAAYERWVVSVAGLAYRVAAVAAWERGPYRIAAATIADEWERLAGACRLPIATKEARPQQANTRPFIRPGEARNSIRPGEDHVSG